MPLWCMEVIIRNVFVLTTSRNMAVTVQDRDVTGINNNF